MTDISIPMYTEFKHLPARNCERDLLVTTIATQNIAQIDMIKIVILLPYLEEIVLPMIIPEKIHVIA